MKKTFKSSSFCNISNFYNGFVWNASKVIFWRTARKFPKIVSFLQFFGDVSKSKVVIAIYVYAIESSRFAFLKNGIGYYAMARVQKISAFEVDEFC